MFTIFRSVLESCRSVPVDLTLAFLGPGAAGKTSIAAIIKGDPLDEVSETIGQDVFHFRRKKAHITAYDLGGGEHIRGIWERYYAEVHAFVYVVDASQTLEEARAVLWEMMQHRFTSGKPVLIFANKQDVDGAHPSGHVSKALDLSELASTHGQSPFHLVEVSAHSTSRSYILKAVDWLITAVLGDYEGSRERRQREMGQQQEIEDREWKEKQERIRKRREERERLRQQKEEGEQRAAAAKEGGGSYGDDKEDGERGQQEDGNTSMTNAQASASYAPCLLPGEAEAPQPDAPAPLTSTHRVEMRASGGASPGHATGPGAEVKAEGPTNDLEVEEMDTGSRGDKAALRRGNQPQEEGEEEGQGRQQQKGDIQRKQEEGQEEGETKDGSAALFQRVRSPEQRQQQSKTGAEPRSQETNEKKRHNTTATGTVTPAATAANGPVDAGRHHGPVKLAPLHPLDVISSVKSIKDAPLLELVRGTAKAHAKLRGEPEPGEGDLQWKMYRAACKECWQQIIKQARKGKRFSMDRLAVQAHAGWSAIAKHAWDNAAYGPRPPQLTPHTEEGWPRDLFETDVGYEVYRQRWQEAQSFDALTSEQKERYRAIAEVELHMFLTKNAAWRGLPIKHRQQKLFEALLVLECVSVHEPETASTV